jgi:hypothetical protein
MASEIDIVNRALGLLGITKVLTGSTVGALEGTDDTEAQVVLWFATCRDALLAAAPWTFGTASILLTVFKTADDAETWADEWQFAYRYPTNTLRVWKIMSRSGRKGVPIPMQVRLTDDGTKVVMTDEAQARAMVMDSTQTLASEWDVQFGLGLTHYVAAMLAMPLRADKELAKQQYLLANEFVARARIAAGVENEPTTEGLPSRFLDARRGS